MANGNTEKLDATRSERDLRVLELPLNRALGLAFDGRNKDGAFTHFVVNPTVAAFGGLHGGALYALLDATCLLALGPLLGKTENAVTHDLHVSVMRTAPVDAKVVLSGRVVRRGRQLAFLEARAECDGKLIAAARVTKSIVALVAEASPKAQARSDSRNA